MEIWSGVTLTLTYSALVLWFEEAQDCVEDLTAHHLNAQLCSRAKENIAHRYATFLCSLEVEICR